MKYSTIDAHLLWRWVFIFGLTLTGVSVADQLTPPPNLTPATPLRTLGPEDFEKAKRVLREGAGQVTPSGRSTPEEMEMDKQWDREHAQINLASNRQTFTYRVTSRFFVFLDNEKYPPRALACHPSDVVSKLPGNFGGDSYPIRFEAMKPGSCMLKNNDFAVTIVVQDISPGR